MKKNMYFVLVFLMIIHFSCSLSNRELDNVEADIVYLEKLSEIKKIALEKNNTYFWDIYDICCDDENNFYVSDRGWNKIFKFDSEGNFILDFGGEGQGPGEFLAHPGKFIFTLSYGNDGNIYATDHGNSRLSIFSKNGEFIKSFTFNNFYQEVQVTSDGNIFVVSPLGKNAINRYDYDMNPKNSFLDSKKILKFPIYKPKRPRMIINSSALQLLLLKDDTLFALSNYSLNVFKFNKLDVQIDEFEINNNIFLNDFKARLKKVVKQGGFVNPFRFFPGLSENLCLAYFNNTIKNWEIYLYDQTGILLGLFRFNEDSGVPIIVDSEGRLYTIAYESTPQYIKIFEGF